jgi:hypothetical protein
MIANIFRVGLTGLYAYLLSGCATTMPMPDDAHFSMVTISVTGHRDNTKLLEALHSFERNLNRQIAGSLEENRIRCVHCENPSSPTELTYIFIQEHKINMDRFNKALSETWDEYPPPFNVTMSVTTPAPVSPPDCSSLSCSGSGCICIAYPYCASGCKKKGTITCCMP